MHTRNMHVNTHSYSVKGDWEAFSVPEKGEPKYEKIRGIKPILKSLLSPSGQRVDSPDNKDGRLRLKRGPKFDPNREWNGIKNGFKLVELIYLLLA